jgi:hypothetical protein
MRTERAEPSAMLRRQVLMGGLAVSASGCGYILYPGRRGRTHGAVDLPVLIIDLLWLIPGLLPGAICLIVDFTSGCIYRGGGRAQTSSPPSPDPSLVTHVDVELDGVVVATGLVQADRRASLEWRASADEAALRARAKLTVRSSQGLVAEAPVQTLT